MSISESHKDAPLLEHGKLVLCIILQLSDAGYGNPITHFTNFDSRLCATSEPQVKSQIWVLNLGVGC